MSLAAGATASLARTFAALRWVMLHNADALLLSGTETRDVQRALAAGLRPLWDGDESAAAASGATVPAKLLAALFQAVEAEGRLTDALTR
jgi:hypothetical protein